MAARHLPSTQRTRTRARWYERFGALPMLDDPLKLILPLSVIADAIKMTGARSSGIRIRDDDDPDP